MTKREAKKVKTGDTLMQIHHGMAKPFVVTGIRTEDEDPKTAVPLFLGDPLAPEGLTYKLCRLEKDLPERFRIHGGYIGR